MDNVVVGEASHDMNNRIRVPNIRQKLPINTEGLNMTPTKTTGHMKVPYFPAPRLH
jgi:hypothetical protein